MGVGTSSIFRSNPNGAEVKTLLNVILKQMFSRADLVDLYSLADPTRCSKYVVVAAKALDKLFLSINLEPRKGPDGKIYFQKLEGIQRANPMGAEQQHTCKMLAFFFIRIFRIYAALTLSVMDSELPASDPITTETRDMPQRRGLVVINPPHLPGFKQKNAWGVSWGTGSWFGRGGELVQGAFPVAAGQPGGSGDYYLDPARAGLYVILNKYLLMPSTNPAQSTSDMRFQDVDITIPQNTLYDNTPPAVGGRTVKDFTVLPINTRPRPSIFYSFNNGEIYSGVAAELMLSRDTNGNTDVTLENIRFTTGDKQAQRKTLTDKLINRRPGDETPQSKSGKYLPGLIQELLIKAAEQIDPPKFSLVEFFKKFNIIDSMDGRVAIKETTITIDNPGGMRARLRIPILYKGKFKLEKEREVSVEIAVEIFGSRKEKIVGEPQQYSISVDMDTMETKPSGLLAMLERKRERTSRFLTGDTDTSTPMDVKGRTVPQYLQNVFDNLLKDVTDGQSTGGLSYDREGRPKPYDSEEIPEEYKVKKIWDALVKDPPVKAHCVARAVQLLNVAAINDPSTGEAYSSVCNVKFPYIGNGSLPKPGESVLTSDGINSLAMLFVDQLAGDNFVPRITQTPKFKEFRERLKTSFQRYETVEQMKASLRDETNLDFKKIKETQMPFCEDNQDMKLKLKGVLITRLRGKVNDLMRQQHLHIARVMQIMFRLFNEKAVRAGNFEINDYILSNGMEALNKLAEEARDLLIDYYSGCEKTYKEGLYDIYNHGGVERTAVEFVPAR
jgi:hypothetical protein